MGKMISGKVVTGEHNITQCKDKIKSVYYKQTPKVNPDVLESIREADAIILSMGSLFTSIIPNFICKEVKKEIDKSKAKIIYVCNIVTQPGETDDFTVTDHIKLINKYLGKRKVDAVVVNTGHVCKQLVKKYETTEQKDLVIFYKYSLSNMKIDTIENYYILIENNYIRHNTLKVSIDILYYLLER